MANGLGLQAPPEQPQGLGLGAPQDTEMLKKWLQSIVSQHGDKNFVQRIANPNIFPNLDLGNGMVGTHLMSWGTMGKDKTPIVYPSIQQDAATGQLQQLDDDQAFERAVQSGEYIPFKTSHEADLFSREYKRLWEK